MLSVDVSKVKYEMIFLVDVLNNGNFLPVLPTT